MNRRDRAVVAILVIVLVVFAGVLVLPRQAAPGPEAEATPGITMPPRAVLREGVVGVAETVTPVTARNRAERALVGLVFSGLVRLGPGTTYQPDLAEAWSSDDAGTTWTFTIRDGRGLARRRPGHRGRRGVHGEHAQEPGRPRVRVRVPGPT